MDFVRSYFFPNATLTSWTFLDHFCHHFWVGLLLLCCCTHPKVMTKMAKKCSTGQSCIRKEVTSYKIGTLENLNFTQIDDWSTAWLSGRQAFLLFNWLQMYLKFFFVKPLIPWTSKRPLTAPPNNPSTASSRKPPSDPPWIDPQLTTQYEPDQPLNLLFIKKWLAQQTKIIFMTRSWRFEIAHWFLWIIGSLGVKNVKILDPDGNVRSLWWGIN